MNQQLEELARTTIKEGLARLSEGNRMMFKRMYAHGNLNTPIDEVVDKMPADKLENAMDQVQRTLDKAGL